MKTDNLYHNNRLLSSGDNLYVNENNDIIYNDEVIAKMTVGSRDGRLYLGAVALDNGPLDMTLDLFFSVDKFFLSLREQLENGTVYK